MASTSHFHMRKKPESIFFNIKGLKQPEVPSTTDSDGNDLEYIKSLETKYEPRKLRKIQDAYVRMEATSGVRETVNNIDLFELIDMCIMSPTSFDFAMMLYKFRGSQFRCVDIVSQKWEQKNDNEEWVYNKDSITLLRGFITSDIHACFTDKLNKLNILIANNYISGEFMTALQLKKSNLEYILMRLPTITFKNAIIKDASELFFYSEILTPNV